MTIHLRKMYVDCRFGQLHMHTSFPSSGGFDELTPLVCLPPQSQTGRLYRPLLRDLGRDRSVYAPDLPGAGESDAPDHPPTVADFAGACCDLLDSLRLKHVDVVAYQTGSLAAIEFALARPQQVRRLALIGVPSSDSGYQVGERLPLLDRKLRAIALDGAESMDLIGEAARSLGPRGRLVVTHAPADAAARIGAAGLAILAEQDGTVVAERR